jgi:hypothetical protein
VLVTGAFRRTALAAAGHVNLTLTEAQDGALLVFARVDRTALAE